LDEVKLRDIIRQKSYKPYILLA